MQVSIRTNVIVNIIRTITMTILSFITFPYVCRILKDAGEGLYAWAATFVYYFTVLAHISLPNVAIREIVKYKDDPDKMSVRIQEVFIIEAIMTLLSFVLMCIVVFAVPQLRENRDLIFIVSINYLISAFTFEWLYIAMEKHVYMAIRSIILLAVVDILIFAYVRQETHIHLYAFLSITITILITISNLLFLPKIFRFRKKEPYDFRKYRKLIGILFLISIVVAVYEKTDAFILGFIDPGTGGKPGVGSYVVGMKGVEIIITIIATLSHVFMPRASYYYAKKDMRQFHNINKYSLNITLFITVPAVAAMAALAEPITQLISGSYQSSGGYWDAGNILIALASYMITHALCEVIYSQILIPMKKERYYAITMLSGAILNITLSLLFGLVFMKERAPLGVAIATSISDATVLIALIIIARRELKTTLFNLNTLKILLLGVLIGAFFFLAGPALANSFAGLGFQTGVVHILEIVTCITLGGIIYLTGLIITKEKLIASLFHRSSSGSARRGRKTK